MFLFNSYETVDSKYTPFLFRVEIISIHHEKDIHTLIVIYDI